MNTRKPRKKADREYKKDTFKVSQEEKQEKRELAIHETLELLGKSLIKFRNITALAEHVSEILTKQGDRCVKSTLVRNSRKGLKIRNPYRLLLLQYEMGKYFGKPKCISITAEDIVEIRKKYPAVDAYCSLKEGETKNLQEEVKLLSGEVAGMHGGIALPQKVGASSEISKQLDKTVKALKCLLDLTVEFFAIDWEKLAIVDLSSRTHEVVIESELLTAYFEALEKSGMKP